MKEPIKKWSDVPKEFTLEELFQQLKMAGIDYTSLEQKIRQLQHHPDRTNRHVIRKHFKEIRKEIKLVSDQLYTRITCN
ncbi:MAG TPA: hypothetical protein VHK91_11510 [Flavisolibacter sp.]|jgi:hypothetical protein|nr:hypothetical protein [Flavisolibacter sp.]